MPSDNNDRPLPNGEVGYRRPPKEHQFRKGKSGNPTGRRKGQRNLSTILDQALSERVPATKNGKRRLVSMLEITVRRMVADAAQGNSKAREQLFRWISLIEVHASVAEEAPAQPAEDAAILQRFKERLLEELRSDDRS